MSRNQRIGGGNAAWVALVATVFACTVNVTSSQAQPARVFVGALGSDSNPCTFAQPCRTFQHAHDTVAAGGEIDVLDPAGYGILTISKAISIQGHGFAGIAATGGNTAITINAGPSDKINLRGLLIDGVGTRSDGIVFNSGASLNVQDCLIRNFVGGYGIFFFPTTAAVLSVSNTIISDIGYGLSVTNITSAPVTATLDTVGLFNLSGIAVNVDAAGASTNVTIAGSVIANSDIGVFAGGGYAAAVLIRDSVVSNNSTGLEAFDGGTIRVTEMVVTGNGTGLLADGGVINSYGDNNIDGNTTDGAPTATIPRE
jgi:hypothetical protein